MAPWVVALAVGCTHDEPGGGAPPPDSDSGTAPCASGDLALALGTGWDAYEPLIDGELVMINQGPDGGWHVWVAADLSNAERDVALHPVMAIPDLGLVQVVGHQQTEFDALAGYDPVACHGQVWGMRAFIDTDWSSLDALCSAGLAPACSDRPSDLICALAGHEGRLCLTAESFVYEPGGVDGPVVDGRSATDCRTVTLVLDPIDVAGGMCAGTWYR